MLNGTDVYRGLDVKAALSKNEKNPLEQRGNFEIDLWVLGAEKENRDEKKTPT